MRHRGLAIVVAVVASLSLAGVALAAGTTLGTAKVKVKGKSETVVVSAGGLTLYTLSGETAKHLKCKSAACLKFWPADKVAAKAKLTKAKGIKGTLSKLHRGKFYQVTLNGHPLYLFAGDKGKGSANGEGIKSFGGTWHVVAG